MDRITIFDVAKKAGVSKSTVSRVLNNKGNVNGKTRKKILKVMDEMNYYPNSAARSLVTKKTNTIGLVVPDITDSFFSQYIKGAEVVGIKNDYNMMLVSSHWMVKEEWRYMKILKEDRVDGILLISGNNIPESYIEFLEEEKIAIVIIDRIIENNIIPTINVDNFNGAYLGTKHLLENGHRKIAIVTGPQNLNSAVQRMNGFKKAMKDYGVDDIENLIFDGYFSEKSGYQATKAILESLREFSAIFYSNDWMAIGGIKALRENRISIPEDISILACDNIKEVSLIDPPLTTLDQPRYKMGYTAMKLLIDIIQNRDKVYPNSIVFNMDLIKRETVRNIKL